MAVTFADVESFPSPAMPLVTPASAIFISLSISIGDSPIVPPTGLPLTWVAIAAGWLVVASRRSRARSAGAGPGLLQSSRGAGSAVPGQFDARNRMPVSACRSLSWLLSCFAVSVFAKTFW
jgi:hypothetical protein